MSNTYENVYNPDVLSCIANLSNDEVFTPPEIANQMLDMLPEELWSDSSATFLDPACKSGVFLREIAKRLIKGLENEIPNLQERIDHIFKKQLYGIAITELTSLLSRRSVYCSKYPNSKYSISQFDNASGNIRFKRIEHTWEGGKCKYCGASQKEYQRDEELETHAYEWIHTLKPEEIFNMKFDVIIGNPPYQLSTNGSYAKSIYNLFVEQSIKLNPKHLVMIVPSRWFSGGLGLDDFRNKMLSDNRIVEIHDFIDASDCFPGVEIKGGVNYFLWTSNHNGDCKVVTHKDGKVIDTSYRPLVEPGMSTFIRNNKVIPILRKVRKRNEKSFSTLISSYDPFGFDVREHNSYRRVRIPFDLHPMDDAYKLYYNGWRKDGVGYVEKKRIRKGEKYIDKYKVLIPKAWGIGNPNTDWLNPLIAYPNECCTETYLVVGGFHNEEEAENCITYISTKFFHLMVSILKITQNTMQGAYQFVPLQDFSKPWNDEELYAKYGFTDEEINFIETYIKPKNLGGETNGK